MSTPAATARETLAQRRFRPTPGLTLAAAAVVALLCGLGTWQVRRLHWREADLAQKNARIDLPPVELSEALVEPGAFSFRRVRARGRWMWEDSFLVIRVPRPDPRTGVPREGAHVMTPLQVEGLAAAVLVDRGWIPDHLRGSFLERDLGTGEAVVTGLAFPLAVVEAPSQPAAAPRREWMHFDPTRSSQVSALRGQLDYPLAPLMLQREDAGDGELPLGGIARPRSPVDHRAYAITWYGLAAVAVATWVALGLQRGSLAGSVRPPAGEGSSRG